MFDKPNELRVELLSASSIHLSWCSPDVGGEATQVAEYIVNWSSSNQIAGGGNKILPGSNHSTIIAELISNTNYDIGVSARSVPGGEDGEVNQINVSTRKK